MMLNLRKRRIRWSDGALIGLLALSLWAGMMPVAMAKYRPPRRPSAPKTTGTNTTRGDCASNSNNQLTALVPYSHVGQTSSGHPTFAWFVPNLAPTKLQFRLFRDNGQPAYKADLTSQPGIMQVSLPPSLPKLAVGSVYRWQVVLVCDPAVASRNYITTAEIQVVEPTSTLQTQLAATQDPRQRVDLYAEAGLWYDALAEAIKASYVDQNSSIVWQLFNELVQSESQAPQEWSDRLKQIQTLERQHQESR
jgi:hypothetical protein